MNAAGVDCIATDKARPCLFVLPVNDAFLVCNPPAGVASLVNGPALHRLRRAVGQVPSAPSYPSLSDDLHQLAVLLAQKPEAPPAATGPLHPLFLGLLPTRSCNIRCAYCDFGADGPQAAAMSPALASAALTWYARFLEEAGHGRMEVHFFGGEPFVAREVVETAVHRSRLLADRHGLALHLEVSTNGVFEPEYAQFVGDYFQAVVLSLDGFQEVHDRHRPARAGRGSFAQARQTAALLARTPTELCLRCCVSTLNVHRLEEIALWFCKEFQPSAINFEPLTGNSSTLAAGLLPPDPYLFARQYAKAHAQTLRHGVKPVYAATEGEPSRTSFCPVGKDALIVSADGRISSCYLPQEAWLERGLDLDVGRLDAQGHLRIDTDAIVRLRRLPEDKPRCARCFCQWVCSGGCHVHHTYPGSPLAYEPFCIQTRLLSACRLLEEMGLGSVAETLLDDRQAMEALAQRPSDLFEDLPENPMPEAA
ncbi:MAG: radical SAM protein [Desulfobulbus sp.]|uniref:radical SAM protein n=1 Tax=Desulfobulbus sp. TaxID=895 RepID=UPI00283FD400|nr:radical SAM protein [Desulfobulbus sp.]MDR2549547.1 radical SAM protein [Desulfobulbus sp.]